jgi:hypothetical protein
VNYTRTDSELAHQRAYEAREASRRQTLTIRYRLLEETPPHDPLVARKVAWRVVRKAGSGREELSQWFYRRTEAIDYVKEQIRRDNNAAKRLGVQFGGAGDMTMGRK